MLIALGGPVLTADYDFWIDVDDAAAFNAAAEAFGLMPRHSPQEARLRGRSVLQNDEHVDVLVARSVPTSTAHRFPSIRFGIVAGCSGALRGSP